MPSAAMSFATASAPSYLGFLPTPRPLGSLDTPLFPRRRVRGATRSLDEFGYKSSPLRRLQPNDWACSTRALAVTPSYTARYYSQQHNFALNDKRRTRLSPSLSRRSPSCGGRCGSARAFPADFGRLGSDAPARSGGIGERRRCSPLMSGTFDDAWALSPVWRERERDEDEDDVWSRATVFEFRSLNDPATNVSMHKGSPVRGRPPQEGLPAANPPPTVHVLDEELERDATSAADVDSDDWLRFTEKGALGMPRSYMRRVVSEDAGEAKVEIATLLGLSHSSSFEELRAEYKLEIKRCHPDLAGNDLSRTEMLEFRFKQLKIAWDDYVEERRRPAPSRPSVDYVPTPGIELGQEQQDARDRARQRAREAAVRAEGAARAAARAAMLQGVRTSSAGRNRYDTGGSSSC